MKITYVTETVSPEQEARWARERHQRDKVSELPDGFTFAPHGRAGTIYYRVSNRVAEAFWEMSGSPDSDIIINRNGFEYWAWPSKQPVATEERERLGTSLQQWLTSAGYRFVLSDEVK